MATIVHLFCLNLDKTVTYIIHMLREVLLLSVSDTITPLYAVQWSILLDLFMKSISKV